MQEPTTTVIEPVEPSETPAVTEPTSEPTCTQCLTPLTWRDTSYTPAGSTLCKRCHQRNKRVADRGHYVIVKDDKGGIRPLIFTGKNRKARRLAQFGA